MAEEDFPAEDELANRQAAGLYPVGRALRETYGADNHDSLGQDLTGLMLELARIDPEAQPLPRGAAPVAAPVVLPTEAAAAAPKMSKERRSWWRSVVDGLTGKA